MSDRTISLHVTKAAAHAGATRARREMVKRRGRSSGWSRLDYVVVPSGRLVRRWKVVER